MINIEHNKKKLLKDYIFGELENRYEYKEGFNFEFLPSNRNLNILIGKLEGEKIKDIASNNGISRERVSQILRTTEKSIKHPKNIKKVFKTKGLE